MVQIADSSSNTLIDVVVVDANAFIKKASLKNLAKKFVTTPSVINELVDKTTRAYVENLHLNLVLEIPDKESLKFVNQQASKSGDIANLSGTDKELIALTYQYHKQLYEVEPVPKTLKINKDSLLEEPTVKEEEEDSAADGDDELDWISAENFEEKSSTNFGMKDISIPTTEKLTQENVPKAACMTTDYTMQNLLLLCGLHIIGIDNMLIKEPKHHVLYCVACFKLSKDKNANFCPNCGYAQLHRIPATTHEDGTLELHFNSRYTPRLKGSRHPVKAPEGGKHASNPIYCRDQRLPEQRAPKVKNKIHLLASNGQLMLEDDELFDDMARLGIAANDDYEFGMNDVQSRAFSLGLEYREGPHPNTRWATGQFHGLRATKPTDHIPKPKHRRK